MISVEDSTTSIAVTGPLPERDHEGYLLYPDQWNPEVALMLAAGEGLELDHERNAIVRFVRDYFEQYAAVPEARQVLKHMRSLWGQERATRRYLYRLFPRGYGQQACKIAGMRKPLKLMLDI